MKIFTFLALIAISPSFIHASPPQDISNSANNVIENINNNNNNNNAEEEELEGTVRKGDLFPPIIDLPMNLVPVFTKYQHRVSNHSLHGLYSSSPSTSIASTTPNSSRRLPHSRRIKKVGWVDQIGTRAREYDSNTPRHRKAVALSFQYPSSPSLLKIGGRNIVNPLPIGQVIPVNTARLEEWFSTSRWTLIENILTSFAFRSDVPSPHNMFDMSLSTICSEFYSNSKKQVINCFNLLPKPLSRVASHKDTWTKISRLRTMSEKYLLQNFCEPFEHIVDVLDKKRPVDRHHEKHIWGQVPVEFPGTIDEMFGSLYEMELRPITRKRMEGLFKALMYDSQEFFANLFTDAAFDMITLYVQSQCRINNQTLLDEFRMDLAVPINTIHYSKLSTDNALLRGENDIIAKAFEKNVPSCSQSADHLHSILPNIYSSVERVVEEGKQRVYNNLFHRLCGVWFRRLKALYPHPTRISPIVNDFFRNTQDSDDEPEPHSSSNTNSRSLPRLNRQGTSDSFRSAYTTTSSVREAAPTRKEYSDFVLPLVKHIVDILDIALQNDSQMRQTISRMTPNRFTQKAHELIHNVLNDIDSELQYEFEDSDSDSSTSSDSSSDEYGTGSDASIEFTGLVFGDLLKDKMAMTSLEKSVTDMRAILLELDEAKGKGWKEEFAVFLYKIGIAVVKSTMTVHFEHIKKWGVDRAVFLGAMAFTIEYSQRALGRIGSVQLDF